MKRLLLSALVGLMLGLSSLAALPAAPAHAATSANCQRSSTSFLGFPTWYKYLDPTFEDGECKINFEFPGSIAKIVLALVEILLRVAGLVAVGYVIYGGIQFILSQGEVGAGNVPKTTIARHTIQNALIGLVIAMVSTFIVRIVGNTLIN